MFSFTQQGLESRHSSDETFPSLGLNVTLCFFDHWQWDTTHGHTSSSKQIRIFLGHQKKMRRRCISLPLAIWIWITCYLIFVRFSVSQIPVSIYFHNITQTARIYYRNLLSEKNGKKGWDTENVGKIFGNFDSVTCFLSLRKPNPDLPYNHFPCHLWSTYLFQRKPTLYRDLPYKQLPYKWSKLIQAVLETMVDQRYRQNR